MNKEKIKARIKSAIVITENECWEWQDYIMNTGYGQFRCDNVLYTTHRAAYLAWNGDIPEELMVRHMCHNKKCCNPNHLLVGTAKDNWNDSRDIQLAANPKGNDHYEAKLTECEVIRLRSLPSGTQVRGMETTYNISRASVYQAIQGKTWKAVTTPPRSIVNGCIV